MKLPALIEILMSNDYGSMRSQLEKTYAASEALIIYMESCLDLDSDVFVFPVEETEDDLLFEKDGLRYHQLFSIDYTLDLIGSDLSKIMRLSSQEIAIRLLQFRLNDA